ncbi:exodeoxyribonuclease VII small subunit [Patescibacteria group bacterium AH-259-L07]|nr:exodeoxyribonuclease VII small subunit [Patescibacteria group bacterium AH-259-L07]
MSKEKQDLKSALEQLERLVNELSSDDVDVEAGLKKFKQGAELITFCRSQLRKAENEFKKLKSTLETEEEGEGDKEE